MITNLPFMRKIASSTLYCILFALLLSVDAFAQPTITNVSPTRVTSRTIITITGTNFTGTGALTVKVGGATFTPTNLTSTSMTIKGVTTTGAVSVTKGTFPVANGATITFVNPVAAPTASSSTRIITDFGGYWSSTSTTTTPVPETNHNLLGFRVGTTVYSTGIADATLTAQSVGFTPADFRGFPVGTNLAGTAISANSNYLAFGKLVDGVSAGNGTVTAPGIAGKTIRDVLSDGTKGLGLGSGVTNIDELMQMDFRITDVTSAKVTDADPDILVTQIADPSTASKTDYYVFTDVNGNVIGSPVSCTFGTGFDAVGTYNVDFFTLTANASFNTAVATASITAGNAWRPIRMIALKLSDFGLTGTDAANIARFKVLPGGDSDPAFFAFNAGTLTILPKITTQPASAAVCTQTSSTVTFTVVATGEGLTYQWKKDGVDVSGATSSSYTITNPTSANLGAYTVVVTNIAGSVTSNVANLTGVITNTAIWTGATNTDWNTVSNWTCGALPSTTIGASIPAGAAHYPILTSATGTANDLTIASGASVIISGTGVLQIAGAISNSGTLNAVDGTVAFIGTTGAQSIPANIFDTHVIKNLTVNNTAGVTLGSATDLTGVLTVTAGAFTTGGFLTLKSNASTTAMIAPVGGSISGNMTIERYIPAKRAFRFMSSPTTGGTIQQNWQENVSPDIAGFGTDITGLGGIDNGFDTSGSNNPSMYTYLNDNPGTGTSWIPVTSTFDPLVAGTPYRILVRGDRTINQSSNTAAANNTTLRSTGSVITGDHVVTNLNPDADGFSLIGNLYQAPVDMNALLTDASSLLNKNFFYVWDPTRNDRGAYVTVLLPNGDNTFTGSVADKYLQPGQACFIQTATAGSPSLTFRESYKHLSTATTAVWKTEENPAQVRMTLYDSAAVNGVGADGLLIQFGDYSNALDSFDAVKPGNQDENIGTMNSSKVMSFESRSMPVAEDIIPISVTQYRKASYVYKVDVNGLTGVNAVLLDKYTNTRTPLTNDAQTQIPFTVDSAVAESVAANRFDIVFESVLGIADNVFGNAVQIYPNPATDNFFIKLPSTEKEIKVKLTNALGQNIYNETVTSQNGLVKIQPKIALQSGIYMVSISNGKSTTTQKLIIK